MDLFRGVGEGFRLLLPLLSFWSHFMDCIDVCLEEKRGDSGVEQVVRMYLVEVTEWKCENGGMGSCWWTVVAGWYFLVVPLWKSVGAAFTEEAESGMWVAREETWWPGLPDRGRMGYLPRLISCRLLRLNLEVRGEHLTSQLSWIAAVWLLITRVCTVYIVDELVLVFSTPYEVWF